MNGSGAKLSLLVLVLLIPLRASTGQSDVDGAGDIARHAALQMSRAVDGHLEQGLHSRGLQPAAICTDAEFLRRACLDLTGVVPTVADVRAFLADTTPDKRARLVDQLLQSPRHATHLAATWRQLLLPADFEVDQLEQTVGLQRWLRRQFANNLRYDRLVAEFLSSEGDQATGPALFYQLLDADPAKLAATTSRIFLGLQIECAQCHDHPFDRWTQRDFWGFAAFFAQLQPVSMMRRDSFRLVDLPQGEVTLPQTAEVVPPRFPLADPIAVDGRGTRRRQLAIWMASSDNPYLGPAAVNRVWQQMFGRGLVEPVDDLGPHRSASHPALFAELNGYFVQQQFDLRQLYRALANTNAYQRTSAASAERLPEDSYGRMIVKRLTPEQLYDSLHRSLLTPGGLTDAGDPLRRQFVAQMRSSSRNIAHYDLGLPQALHMMNGPPIAPATSDPQQGLLGALQAPFLDNRQRIEILFLATLSRFPRDEELAVFDAHLQTDGSPAAACGDLLWALLNSAEYQFNH